MQLEKDLINGYHYKYLNYTSSVALNYKYNIAFTVIGNSSGLLKFGYNIKIKNDCYC